VGHLPHRDPGRLHDRPVELTPTTPTSTSARSRRRRATSSPVGKITLGTGHAAKHLGRQAATEHYDHTGAVVADVVAGEDEFGPWIAGALRPDMAASRVRELRAATLSGDWRNVNGHLELVGLLAVNVPGFPVPRSERALVAATESGMRVESLVAAGMVDHDFTKTEQDRLAGLAVARRADSRASPPSPQTPPRRP
jgi:hypothetical protein